MCFSFVYESSALACPKVVVCCWLKKFGGRERLKDTKFIFSGKGLQMLTFFQVAAATFLTLWIHPTPQLNLNSSYQTLCQQH